MFLMNSFFLYISCFYPMFSLSYISFYPITISFLLGYLQTSLALTSGVYLQVLVNFDDSEPKNLTLCDLDLLN